jgi:hypothetical protein
MRAASQRSPVRFVLVFTRAEHGRVEGVLVREGSDDRESFSGWLDLLRLLEAAAAGSSGGQHEQGEHHA